MVQSVNVPGVGQLNFPDGMSQADMASAIQRNFPQIHQDAVPISEGKAQGQRIMADLDQMRDETGNGKAMLGLGETALNAITGLGSSVVGGFRGLAALATGGSASDAAKAVQDTQQDYTYQPRTGVGKLGSEVVSLPLNIAKSAASSIGGDIGQAVNGNQGRVAGEAIGHALPDVAATLAGGAQAMKAVRGAPQVTPPPEATTPVVDYDVPTFVRNGNPPIQDVPVKPVITPSMVAEQMRQQAAERATAASQVAPITAAADLAANAPTPPALPEMAPIKSPLDSVANNTPAAKITAPLLDNSDIDGVLQKFGVELPNKVQKPTQLSATEDANTKMASPFAAIEDAAKAPEISPEVLSANIQSLRDVGLDNIRESAITGDAARAAREFQNGKITSEPAGQFWFDQFQRETEAMKNYAQRMVDDTGGRLGLDEASLERKGQDIAAPYDAARAYFEKAKENLYNEADKQAAATGKPVETTSVDAVLKDPDFRATLMAKDQQSLLNTIESQFNRFKELDPNGLSVVNAEKFRKWLNKVWSPATSETLGAVKGALDDDVFRSAGGDVYQAGRAMHQLEKQTLDNPNGIAKLMDSDPYTPINRNTPYEKIPDKIMTLSNGQFKHIIDTYQSLPEELQPAAQQAIATLKAHYAERILNSGTETTRGNPRQLWDAGGVRKFVSDNSAKLPLVFNEGELAQIGKLLDAGDLLRVNPAYPGAAAQLANASKAGLVSHVIGRLSGGAGAATGALMGGPGGAAIGGLLGETAAAKFLHSTAERRALAEAQSGVISNFEPPPTNPIEAWETAARAK